MNWLWIVLAVVGLFVAWWVLKIVMSLAVPPEVSGRALLKQEAGIMEGRPASMADEHIREILVRNGVVRA